jgi:hypothetical protein
VCYNLRQSGTGGGHLFYNLPVGTTVIVSHPEDGENMDGLVLLLVLLLIVVIVGAILGGISFFKVQQLSRRMENLQNELTELNRTGSFEDQRSEATEKRPVAEEEYTTITPEVVSAVDVDDTVVANDMADFSGEGFEIPHEAEKNSWFNSLQNNWMIWLAGYVSGWLVYSSSNTA